MATGDTSSFESQAPAGDLMQLVVNVIYGIPFGVGLYLIGIPNSLLWAVLAVLLRFIPYLGPLLSATFPLLLALAVDPGWTILLLTLGLILTLEVISNNFIEPWLYGSSTNMSAVAIIFAAIFWTALWGPVGLLLATPLTFCLAVAGRYFPQLAFLDVLLGRAPALTLPERLYQRLLAGDVDESSAIAEDYVDDGHDFLQLYDDVVLPALRSVAVDHARYGLTAERRLTVMRTAMELISELGDRDEQSPASAEEGDDIRAESSSVLCAAGRSALDLAVAAALEQLLERRGFRVRLVSAEALAPEHLQAAGLESFDVICLSYLDPSPPARIRQTVRRIVRHAREVPVLIGLWSLPDQATGRLGSLPSHASIVATLREAVQRVEAATARSPTYIPAPVPTDEEERLADLNRLRALAASDERLERFTRRLSKAFDVPIASFNLIDEDRQHFRGPVGLPEDLATAGSSPRDTSICGYVVAENQAVIIEDALKDPRFAENPFLLEHGIRFYAGVPLQSHRGRAIGSLCVMDASPRTVTEEERTLLRELAEEAMTELEEEAAVSEFSPRAAGDADQR